MVPQHPGYINIHELLSSPTLVDLARSWVAFRTGEAFEVEFQFVHGVTNQVRRVVGAASKLTHEVGLVGVRLVESDSLDVWDISFFPDGPRQGQGVALPLFTIKRANLGRR